jgi:hypothetical protein
MKCKVCGNDIPNDAFVCQICKCAQGSLSSWLAKKAIWIAPFHNLLLATTAILALIFLTAEKLDRWRNDREIVAIRLLSIESDSLALFATNDGYRAAAIRSVRLIAPPQAAFKYNNTRFDFTPLTPPIIPPKSSAAYNFKPTSPQTPLPRIARDGDDSYQYTLEVEVYTSSNIPSLFKQELPLAYAAGK